MDKTHIEWSEVEFGVDILAKRLPGVKWLAIYATPRGGLVLASMLAYKLDVPKVYTTLGVTTDHARIYGEQYLVIDDIIDTGRTHDSLRQRFKKGTFAALCRRHLVERENTYVAYTIHTDAKVVFPWAPGDTREPGETPI